VALSKPVREAKVKFEVERFVLEAVVAKNAVEVALVAVALTTVRLVIVEDAAFTTMPIVVVGAR